MRYHSHLLKQYISINDTAENIANNLILKACEVEEIIKRQLPDDVVIGKVIELRKHPQADKLVICVLDCGEKGKYQICTGGENVVLDSYVPVALPGCYLPVIDLKIDPRKMRGEESNGMICSKGELGIKEDEDQHWIWTMQYNPSTPESAYIQQPDFDDITDADCGIKLKDKYPRLESYVFDVDNKTITHRPDLTGHFGLAWELHAMYGNDAAKNILRSSLQPLVEKQAMTPLQEMFSNAKQHTTPLKVSCEGVAVYTTLSLQNCTTKPSTFLTRTLLSDCGNTPRLNWVDFSNYVMLLTGQPIHCFDADTIVGGIHVRYAKKGETFTDLMDTTHILLPTDIVIADDKKILALGGVMGGKESAITSNTKNIIIEVAHFDHVAVRKTGTRLSLRTDAELRFEKHINPVFSAHAVGMVLDILQHMKKDLGDYEFVGVAHYAAPGFAYTYARSVEVDRKRISHSIFGDETDISDAAKQTLKDLGFGVQETSVTVPRWRSPDDINGEHDIVEEVIRLYGYDKIPGKILYGSLEIPKNQPVVDLARSIEETLTQRFAFDQCETYPRAHEKLLTLFGETTDNLYQIQNAPAPELQYLRTTMLYGLLDIVLKNHKGTDTIRIFDLGKIRPDLKETYTCGMLLYTNPTNIDWQKDTWFMAKQALVQTIRSMEIHGEITYKPTKKTGFHPYKQCDVYLDDVAIGTIAQIHPRIMSDVKLPEGSYCTYAALNIDACTTIPRQWNKVTYKTLQDQLIWRDLCFMMDTSQSRQPLRDALATVPEVQDVRIFDLYVGDKLPEGKKSLAFSFQIQGDGSMTTDQINTITKTVIAACEKTGATLR